jgi:hypothetical protein
VSGFRVVDLVGYGLHPLPHLGGVHACLPPCSWVAGSAVPYRPRRPGLSLLPVPTPVLRMCSSWQ